MVFSCNESTFAGAGTVGYPRRTSPDLGRSTSIRRPGENSSPQVQVREATPDEVAGLERRTSERSICRRSSRWSHAVRAADAGIGATSPTKPSMQLRGRRPRRGPAGPAPQPRRGEPGRTDEVAEAAQGRHVADGDRQVLRAHAGQLLPHRPGVRPAGPDELGSGLVEVVLTADEALGGQAAVQLHRRGHRAQDAEGTEDGTGLPTAWIPRSPIGEARSIASRENPATSAGSTCNCYRHRRHHRPLRGHPARRGHHPGGTTRRVPAGFRGLGARRDWGTDLRR